jgi:peptidoglycan hydrolase-like protein with peptidoglycan-binding domain
MSNTIIPGLIRAGIAMLTRPGGEPARAVQTAVNTVKQAMDTFVANAQSRGAGGIPAQPYPGAPAGEPMAAGLKDINIGVEGQTQDPVGPNDSAPHGVEVVQRFLGRLGYLEMGGASYGHYGEATKAAVEQFQRNNGLKVTGTVDNTTLDAMQNPHPRAGFGAQVTDEKAQLQQPLFAQAASFYGAQLGLPTSAVTEKDGTTRQTFEHGSVVMDPNGKLQLLNGQGGPLFKPQDYEAAQAQANGSFINQMAGDTDGDGNQNCGYASANMSLSYLGVPGWSLKGVSAEEGFNSTMALKELGQPGSKDTDPSYAADVGKALNTDTMASAGVHAEVWTNEWNGSREGDVDKMKLAFMNGEQPVAFVVAGNPATGWGKEAGMAEQYRGEKVFDGGHFVSVVGYNQDTGKFLVMDPMAKNPIEVSAEDLAKYMTDQNVSTGEVLQVTYNPPAAPPSGQ